MQNFLTELFEALDWIVDNSEIFMYSENLPNIRKFGSKLIRVGNCFNMIYTGCIYYIRPIN